MLFVCYFSSLNLLKPVIIMPNRSMIIRFQMHWFRSPDSNCPLHKLSLIVVVNGSSCILFLIKLNKSKASLFLRNMIDRYLNRLDFSKCIEKRKEDLFSSLVRKISHVNCSLVVVLVHSLLIIIINIKYISSLQSYS
jgi:hypothetical protein